DSDNSIRVRWANDGSVGFRAHGRGRQVRGDRRTGSRTRSAGVAIESIGIFRQSSASAPAAGGMVGANIGPFAQVGFARNHSAGLAKLLRNSRVLGRFRALESERTTCSLHPVRGIDVVFDQHGNSVQGPARAFLFSLLVEGLGIGQGIGVEFNDAVQAWTILVDVLNS